MCVGGAGVKGESRAVEATPVDTHSVSPHYTHLNMSVSVLGP
jgi:hypothetical protein